MEKVIGLSPFRGWDAKNEAIKSLRKFIESVITKLKFDHRI